MKTKFFKILIVVVCVALLGSLVACNSNKHDEGFEVNFSVQDVFDNYEENQQNKKVSTDLLFGINYWESKREDRVTTLSKQKLFEQNLNLQRTKADSLVFFDATVTNNGFGDNILGEMVKGMKGMFPPEFGAYIDSNAKIDFEAGYNNTNGALNARIDIGALDSEPDWKFDYQPPVEETLDADGNVLSSVKPPVETYDLFYAISESDAREFAKDSMFDFVDKIDINQLAMSVIFGNVALDSAKIGSSYNKDTKQVTFNVECDTEKVENAFFAEFESFIADIDSENLDEDYAYAKDLYRRYNHILRDMVKIGKFNLVVVADENGNLISISQDVLMTLVVYTGRIMEAVRAENELEKENGKHRISFTDEQLTAFSIALASPSLIGISNKDGEAERYDVDFFYNFLETYEYGKHITLDGGKTIFKPIDENIDNRFEIEYIEDAETKDKHWALVAW